MSHYVIHNPSKDRTSPIYETPYPEGMNAYLEILNPGAEIIWLSDLESHLYETEGATPHWYRQI